MLETQHLTADLIELKFLSEDLETLAVEKAA
jgi:hypothetical protein